MRSETSDIDSDIDSVLERWKTDYETLHNNADENNTYDDALLSDIRNRLQNHQSYVNDIDISELNRPIDRDEVQEAILRSKLGKSVGVDEIPSEIFRNDTCIDLLYKLIKFCFTEGHVPKEWLTSVISPIPKPKMDPLDPLEYSPISLISVPCKIYADILNKRLTKWLEQNDILAKEQNGFRKDRSCLYHLYVLSTIIKNRKLQKRDTFICFVDAKKAFDNANRDMLWHKLLQIGIKGTFLDAIKSLYDATQGAVKLGHYMTDIFPVKYGVQQECKMSPTLYSVCINDLADDIRALNAGVELDKLNISILLYADDVALIAPGEQNLQKMLDCINS